MAHNITLGLIYVVLAIVIVVSGVIPLIYFRAVSAPTSIPLRHSIDTTLLVGPLSKAGEIDYARAARNYFSRGVTRESNGQVWQIKNQVGNNGKLDRNEDCPLRYNDLQSFQEYVIQNREKFQ